MTHKKKKAPGFVLLAVPHTVPISGRQCGTPNTQTVHAPHAASDTTYHAPQVEGVLGVQVGLCGHFLGKAMGAISAHGRSKRAVSVPADLHMVRQGTMQPQTAKSDLQVQHPGLQELVQVPSDLLPWNHEQFTHLHAQATSHKRTSYTSKTHGRAHIAK